MESYGIEKIKERLYAGAEILAVNHCLCEKKKNAYVLDSRHIYYGCTFKTVLALVTYSKKACFRQRVE